ncbi:MAG TPA: DUF433 domain-containing protein [Gemmataceae bacterium]|nr:DUF433 domain-containing protein [Gemmataceae bacterium]
MPAAPVTLDAEVVSDPRLRHGEPILAGTATPVRAIADLWNQGLAPEEIPIRLPHLALRQVFAALYYYLGHRQEIDASIAANRVPESLSGKRFDPATGKVQ